MLPLILQVGLNKSYIEDVFAQDPDKIRDLLQKIALVFDQKLTELRNHIHQENWEEAREVGQFMESASLYVLNEQFISPIKEIQHIDDKINALPVLAKINANVLQLRKEINRYLSDLSGRLS